MKLDAYDTTIVELEPGAAQQNFALRALAAADAINVIGISQLLAEVVAGLAVCPQNHFGTQWVNQHPIVRFLVDKLIELTNPSGFTPGRDNTAVVRLIATGAFAEFEMNEKIQELGDLQIHGQER